MIHGAVDYARLLQQISIQLDINIVKCLGQGNDGVAFMNRKFRGVQQLNSFDVPNVVYTHCCAYNINLIICSYCSNISSDFSRQLLSLRSFFKSSSHNIKDMEIKSLAVFIIGENIIASTFYVFNILIFLMIHGYCSLCRTLKFKTI